MFCYSSDQILLVIDGADALYEGGGKEARESLATFVDALCCTNSNLTSSNLLKLLVTSEYGILESTDQCLSNSGDWVGGQDNVSTFVSSRQRSMDVVICGALSMRGVWRSPHETRPDAEFFLLRAFEEFRRRFW